MNDAMPNLKELVVTYTMHTLQADLIIPFQAWKLGPLTKEVTLTPNFEDELEHWGVKMSVSRRGFFETSSGRIPLNVKNGVKVSLMGIHGRERETFPAGKALRPPPLPADYRDWFG